MPEHRLYRSYLYAPGSRPDICRKALAAGADAVVLDLEDAVAPADKATARQTVAALVNEGRPLTCAIHVRINRRGDGYDHEDIQAVVGRGLDGLRLPKASNAEEIREVDRLLDEAEAAAGLERGSVGLYPTIESALGVVQATALASACGRVQRLAFGSTDFLADISAPQIGDERDATLLARSQLVLAARVAGVGAPVDSVHTRVGDLAGLRAGAVFARSLGFFGKSIIHPSQIDPVHEIFTPGPDELAHARQVMDAFAEAGEGALLLGGTFVDPAVVARAEAIVTLAESLEHRGEAVQ